VVGELGGVLRRFGDFALLRGGAFENFRRAGEFADFHRGLFALGVFQRDFDRGHCPVERVLGVFQRILLRVFGRFGRGLRELLRGLLGSSFRFFEPTVDRVRQIGLLHRLVDRGGNLRFGLSRGLGVGLGLFRGVILLLLSLGQLLFRLL